MKWNGRSYRPINQIPIKKREFNMEEALRPLGQKMHDTFWVANVYKEPDTSPVPPSSQTPTPTPTYTPTPSGVVFDTDYQAVLSYASSNTYTEPTFGDKVLQNQLVLDLKSAGIWNKLDILYVFKAGATTSDSLRAFSKINWKSPSNYYITENATYSGNYQEDLGWKGTPATDPLGFFLDTNFNPTLHGTGYTLNDASVSTYVTKEEGTSVWCGIDGAANPLQFRKNSVSVYLNGSSFIPSPNVPTQGIGLKTMTRSGATDIHIYSSTTYTTKTQASTSLPNASITILNSNTQEGQDWVGYFTAGAYLTESEISVLDTIMETYMDTVGPIVTNTPTVTPTKTPTATPTSTVTPTMTYTPSATLPSPGQTEAETYMSAVIAGGGTLDATASGATYQLFADLFNYGLWSKIDAFYPLLGGNSSGGQAVNGKSPGTFNMTWNGGITFSTNGVLSNGSTGYGNTGYIDATNGTLNSVHLGLYTTTDVNFGSGAVDGDMGAFDGTDYTLVNIRTSGSIVGGLQSTAGYSASNNPSNGFNLFVRPSSTQIIAYRNGSSLGTQTVNSVGRVNTRPHFVMTTNQNGSISTPTTRQYNFFTIGTSLTPTEVSNYSTAVINFNTTLGRA